MMFSYKYVAVVKLMLVCRFCVMLISILLNLSHVFFLDFGCQLMLFDAFAGA